MPELRQDPVTLRWSVIATERAKRPHTFSREAQVQPKQELKCPFCAGHESETPPEVFAYRDTGSAPDTPGWRVRVVPNLYPAFGPASGAPGCRVDGPYNAMSALGVHEVLISTPHHYRDIGDLTTPEVRDIVAAYVERYRAHMDNPIVQYIMIINNIGPEAGASREHPHSQLFGIPLVPDTVREEARGLERYRVGRGACGYCDVIAEELASRERVICENDAFLVFAPYASRVPFESWIIPKAHSPFFERMEEVEQHLFAEALSALASKLATGLNKPPLNYYIHTSPCHEDLGGTYHWHLELLPKLSIAAGFELGTAIMVNTVLPEQAAEFLRTVKGGGRAKTDMGGNGDFRPQEQRF